PVETAASPMIKGERAERDETREIANHPRQARSEKRGQPVYRNYPFITKHGYNQRFERNLDIVGFGEKCRVDNVTTQPTLRRIVCSYCTFFSGFLRSRFVGFIRVNFLYFKSA